MRAAVLFALVRLISIPSFTAAYVYTFVRQSQPTARGEKISQEVLGQEPKSCTRISYSRGGNGDNPNRLVAIKVWTNPMFGRAPWAFAFYQDSPVCNLEGGKPSLIAYFFPRNDVDNLQIADWGPLAVQTGILPKFRSWQELKPDTPDWKNYIVDTGIKPGEILLDTIFGGQNLDQVTPELAYVKFWDLSKAYCRFNANMDVIRDDNLMQMLLSGEATAGTYFPELLNSLSQNAIGVPSRQRCIPGVRFQSVPGTDWAEGIRMTDEYPEVEVIKDEGKMEYGWDDPAADTDMRRDPSVQEALKEQYDEFGSYVENFQEDYRYEDPALGKLEENWEYYYDSDGINVMNRGNFDPYYQGETAEGDYQDDYYLKKESELEEEGPTMSLKVEYDDTQAQSLFEEEPKEEPFIFASPKIETEFGPPDPVNTKLEEEPLLAQNPETLPWDYMEQMQALTHQLPNIPTFIMQDLQQVLGLDTADSSALGEIVWNLRRQYGIAEPEYQNRQRLEEQLRIAQLEAQLALQRAQRMSTDQIQQMYEVVRDRYRGGAMD
ncbi:hypothetical protein Dda_2238 [Drechslerella dactyloides]|uniref:Uncharacterized protein n=1 Tax=Drechslerella dactyloides TaxID=74499 RepID=A0AAD6J354_DREDA|nr:hypothetical protein Dda_2238 [Drechslerella dactyloides]